MEEKTVQTRGVRTLTGDPKKAIIKLSLPMMLAMSIQVIYNLVDAIWVSGLGADALSAVGFFFPFMFLIMGLSNGIGIGASSAISRRIGAKDKSGADAVSIHAIILTVLLGMIITVPAYMLAPSIFDALGADDVLGMTVAYARVLFAGTVVIFFMNVTNNILRGEGDTKRAMYAIVLGSILNIILDPIFIYVLDQGVAGAAQATMLSIAISAILISYWLFFKRDTYVTIHFKAFTYSWDILSEILRVGIPASIQQMSMSLSMLVLNGIVVVVAGSDGVAVYSTGWRVVSLAIVPLLGIATSVTAVTGAAYGMKAYGKLNTAHRYAVMTGFKIELILAAFTFIFAPQIASVFTHADTAAHLAPDITRFLRIICIFYPTTSFGMQSSAMFQGTGNGTKALVATVFRSIIATLPTAYVLGIPAGFGLSGIWAGIVIGNVIGSVAIYAWSQRYIRSLGPLDSSA
jgi:putative MATE family efflux protein